MINKVFIQETILDLVKEEPGISAPKLAEKLSISRVSAFRYLRNMVLLQKIRIKGQGKATRYFPHESLYVGANIANAIVGWNADQVNFLKEEILFALSETYSESDTKENLDAIFDKYCMYIATDDTILVGFDAFLGWCTDSRHDYSDRIVAKSIEYLEIIGSIEYRRRKNGFLDAGESARNNLKGITEIGFNSFLFCMPSVLDNGFGRTRTALELYYGKLNGNRYLLESAIKGSLDMIISFVEKEQVDCYIITPPTQGRNIQFRDVLNALLHLKLPVIKAEKVSPFGKILRPQKEIQGPEKRKERVENALISLEVTIPKELHRYKHVAIFDDSFTTGATPNTIALKLRDAEYKGKITIITICGSFDYDLGISEDEI